MKNFMKMTLSIGLGLFLAGAAGATILYDDGFESPGGSGRIVNVTDNPHTGSYSRRLQFDEGGYAEWRFSNTFGQQTEIYIRWYQYFPDGTENFCPGGSCLEWYHRDTESSDNNKWMRVWNDVYSGEGSVKMGLTMRPIYVGESNSGTTTGESVGSICRRTDCGSALQFSGLGFTLTDAYKGRWICFEAHFKLNTSESSPNGRQRFWVEGNLTYDSGPGQAWPATLCPNNWFRSAYFMGATNARFESDTYCYVDDFVVSTAYVGPIGSPAPPPDPPEISGVEARNETTSAAEVVWTTDQPSTSQVEWGTTTSYGNLTATDPSLVASHSVSLSGLSPDTTYHFRVRSENGNSDETVSGDYTFTTLQMPAGPDDPPAAPTGLEASIDGNEITLTWAVNGEVDLAGYILCYGSTPGSRSSEVDVGIATTYTVMGVSDTTYYFSIVAVDSAGQESPLSNGVKVDLASGEVSVIAPTDDPSTPGTGQGNTPTGEDLLMVEGLEIFPNVARGGNIVFAHYLVPAGQDSENVSLRICGISGEMKGDPVTATYTEVADGRMGSAGIETAGLAVGVYFAVASGNGFHRAGTFTVLR